MDFNLDSYIKILEKNIMIFKESLPSSVSAAVTYVEGGSKIPFKTLLYREVMIHRITDLGEAILILLKSKKYVPALALIRSVMESIGYFKIAFDKVEEVVNSKEVGDTNDVMEKLLLSSRLDVKKNFSTTEAIQSVENLIPGYRNTYNALCDYAHPNLPSLLGAYSQYDKSNMTTHFSESELNKSVETFLLLFNETLGLFQEVYNNMVKDYEEYIRICSSDQRPNVF